jgi:hypothetical protein
MFHSPGRPAHCILAFGRLCFAPMMRLYGALRHITMAVLAASFSGCASPEAPGPDLAVLMGEMQRHSMKLGYAIEARNPALAAFYLHEVEEALEGLEAIEEHDDFPIAAPARTIMRPLLDPLQRSVDGDWPSAAAAYAALIDGCNRCHGATEHEFVVVTVPSGPPPYNQKFSVD